MIIASTKTGMLPRVIICGKGPSDAAVEISTQVKNTIKPPIEQ
ncbi:hypothetical protein [Scopulibacillus daqui]|nr:hypothetical protein [Scopulibacillus daqui]